MKFLINKITLLFVFITFSTRANSALATKDVNQIYLLENHCDLLHGNYNSQEILQHSKEFKPYSFQNLVTGVQEDNIHWFSFSVRNETSRAIFLNMPHFKFGKIWLYEFKNGELRLLKKAGAELETPNEILNNADIFELDLVKNQEKKYFLSVNRLPRKIFWATIQTDYALLSSNYKANLFEGILLGCLLFISIYQILIYFITHEKDYLRLSIYLMSLFFLVFVTNGHSLALLCLKLNGFQVYYILLASTALFSFLFCFYFLEITSKQNKTIWNLSILMIIAFVIVFIAALIHHYAIAHIVIIVASSMSSILLIYTGIKRLKMGFKPAQYFIVAYLPPSIAIIIYNIAIIGYFDYSWLFHNLLTFAFDMHALLFSGAVAYKIKTYRQEAETILLEQKEGLELKVSARTQALANEKMKLQEQTEKLKMVMKELHHRVKNNLTIVSGLLELQANRLEDKNSILAFQEGQQRIEAMSLIHQRLYKTEQFSSINMYEYIDELLNNLLNAYGYDRNNMTLYLDIEYQELDIDIAIPLGLILNELITNALKYAFSATNKPMLSIRLLNRNGIFLEVKDNGLGVNIENWNAKNNSFGKRLIMGLSEQIGGVGKMENNHGTCFTLLPL